MRWSSKIKEIRLHNASVSKLKSKVDLRLINEQKLNYHPLKNAHF